MIYPNKKDLRYLYSEEEKFPVIVFFLQGVLRGSKEMGKDIGEKLAKNGVGFVSANYRVSPIAKYPDHLNDAQAAVEWTLKNIESFGEIKKSIHIRYLGAYLSAVMGLNKNLKIHKMTKIRGIILISPFLYVEETVPVRIKKDPKYKSIWGTNPKDWKEASVSQYTEGNNVNLISIMAEYDEDWRKEQNKRLINELKMKQQLSYIEIPNRNHSSLVKEILEKDDQVLTTIVEFIQRTSIN